MSRKSKRPAAAAAAPATSSAPLPTTTSRDGPVDGRRRMLFAGGAALVAVGGAAAYLLAGDDGPPAAQRPELTRAHAPELGSTAARVQIVEFIDPACETCAAFYPLVKQMLAEHTGRLRLAMRHVGFHPGADEVVRMLEASRAQDQYWRVLETLLALQDRWVLQHVAQPDVALRLLGSLPLDLARLQADMRSPEIAERMQRDRADAAALGVEKTPEYFVNGRQMTSFGRQQLQALVRDELRRAY